MADFRSLVLIGLQTPVIHRSPVPDSCFHPLFSWINYRKNSAERFFQVYSSIWVITGGLRKPWSEFRFLAWMRESHGLTSMTNTFSQILPCSNFVLSFFSLHRIHRIRKLFPQSLCQWSVVAFGCQSQCSSLVLCQVSFSRRIKSNRRNSWSGTLKKNSPSLWTFCWNSLGKCWWCHLSGLPSDSCFPRLFSQIN